MTHTTYEMMWLRSLVTELGFSNQTPMSMHYDNQAVIYITNNSVMITYLLLSLLPVSSLQIYLLRVLPLNHFEKLCNKLDTYNTFSSIRSAKLVRLVTYLCYMDPYMSIHLIIVNSYIYMGVNLFSINLFLIFYINNCYLNS